tara:strand:+ start:30 stop:149 length:120 start_codon:yes stop_codon:yes gene_type:complete
MVHINQVLVVADLVAAAVPVVVEHIHLQMVEQQKHLLME